MKYTQEDRRLLQHEAKHAHKPYVRTRALALLNLADGRGHTEVAQIFRVSRQALYNWEKRFARGGPDALLVQPGRGRKPTADLDELAEYVRQSPRNFGIGRTRWTLALLAQVVPSLKGFSAYGVQQALRRAGYRYKRGQPWLHSPDPQYNEKKKPSKPH